MKPYQELTFTDDYMFAKIMQNDSDLCRRLVSLLLDMDIREVKLVKREHELSITSDSKGVRLDVYVNDDKDTVFDLEMQTANKGNLRKRSRYYQSIIDIDNLARGGDYDELPQSYVIFLCTFDLFEKGLPKYEFVNTCLTDPTLKMEEGTSKLFINAQSKTESMSEDMRALFDYMLGMAPQSDLTRDIDASIIRAKTNRRWEADYVIFQGKLYDEIREAKAEAAATAQNEILSMNSYLITQKRYDDLARASIDSDFRQTILDEMHSANYSFLSSGRSGIE